MPTPTRFAVPKQAHDRFKFVQPFCCPSYTPRYVRGQVVIDLVVSASDCSVRTQVRITPRAVVLIAIAAAIYSLGHGLHTFTTVPCLG